MNVILDIDETFVQFVGPKDWENLAEAEKVKYKTTEPTKGGVFILRPHFHEFFKFLFENAATVSLWTLSDREYADHVAEIIRKETGKKVKNVWAEEEAEEASNDYGRSKSLKYIWYSLGKFQPNNTLLVDDLEKNTQNVDNIRNGIQLKAFNPLGEKLSPAERKEGKIRDGNYKDLSEDDTLIKVMAVIQGVIDKYHPFPGSTKVLGGKRRRRKTLRRNRKMNLLTRKRR
jgi:hypothetical protein